MSHVFISYSRQDKRYKQELVKRIEHFRFQVWHDDHIEYGDPWWPTIETEIENCAAFLLIMSPEAEKSKWVRKEISIADNLDKPIFPFWFRGDIFKRFLDLQCIDVRPQVSDDGKKRYKFPPTDFYRQLRKFAPILPLSQSERTKGENRGLVSISHQQPNKPHYANNDNPAEAEVEKWAAYRSPGNNDYYGMTMLALALESMGTVPTHGEAIIHLKRAFKLEPRILDRTYMTKYHVWTDDQQKLIERIIRDAKFR